MQSRQNEATEQPVIRASLLSALPLGDGRNFWTVRLVLPPGSEFPYWTRPGPTIVQIEAGKLALTAVTGNVDLTFGTGEVVRETSAKGREYLLAAGDTASFTQGVQQSIRNPVTMPTAIVVTMISPDSELPFNGLWTSQGWQVVYD